jgi:hypothetical protein
VARRRVGGVVGFERNAAILVLRLGEVLAIAHRPPGAKVVATLGAGRDHFQQHDGFAEMIEIIGGEPGRRVDVGAREPRRAALLRLRAIGRNAMCNAHLTPGRPLLPSLQCHAPWLNRA